MKLQTGKSSAAANGSAVPAALRAAAARAPVLGGIAAPAHVVSGSQRNGSLQQEVLRQPLHQQQPTACGSATAVPGTTMLQQGIQQLTAASTSTKKQQRPQPAVLSSDCNTGTPPAEPAAVKKRRISRFAAVREQDRCGHCKTCLNRAMKKVSVVCVYLVTSSCMVHGFTQGVLQGMLTWQVGLTRA